MVSNIDLKIRKTLLKTYMWSVAFYGCEAWTIGKGERRRIEGFEMWCYRKLLKISWVGKVTNEDVWNAANEKKSLYPNIKRRLDRFIDHTLRHEVLVGTILEATVKGCKRIGRQRLEYTKQIIFYQESTGNWLFKKSA